MALDETLVLDSNSNISSKDCCGMRSAARQCLTEFDVCLFVFPEKNMREIQIVFQYFQPNW